MNKTVKAWLQASRPFSFTASMVPVILGGAMGYFTSDQFHWLLLPLVIICSLLFHAGTNLVSDYCDHKKNIDTDYTFGGSRVIQQNLIKPKTLLIGGLSMFAVAVILAIPMIYVHGLPMVIIGAIGLMGGIFYTAMPVAYKYVGLGDLMVFILMGPLMVIGSYFALTGTMNTNVILISLPIGCLVAAILWANNLRDIKHDSDAGIKTLAIILGIEKAKIGYNILVIAAYLLVVTMVLLKIISVFALAVLITLPLAIKDIKAISNARVDNPQASATLDVETAKLHLGFGVMLIIAVILGGVL